MHKMPKTVSLNETTTAHDCPVRALAALNRVESILVKTIAEFIYLSEIKHFSKYYLLIEPRAEFKPINYCENHFHQSVQKVCSAFITHKIINMRRLFDIFYIHRRRTSGAGLVKKMQILLLSKPVSCVYIG